MCIYSCILEVNMLTIPCSRFNCSVSNFYEYKLFFHFTVYKMNNCFTYTLFLVFKKIGKMHAVYKETAKINICVNVIVQQDFS